MVVEDENNLSGKLELEKSMRFLGFQLLVTATNLKLDDVAAEAALREGIVQLRGVRDSYIKKFGESSLEDFRERLEKTKI